MNRRHLITTALFLAAVGVLCLLLLTGCSGRVVPALSVRHVERVPFSNVGDTRSMEPLLHGGDFVVLRPYKPGEKLRVGYVVVFRRDAKTPRCLHMIAAIDRRGNLLMTGINNRRSDGWFPPETVVAVAVAAFTTRNVKPLVQ